MSNGKENNSFNVIANIRKVRSNRARAVILDNSVLKIAKEQSEGASEIKNSIMMTLSELKSSQASYKEENT